MAPWWLRSSDDEALSDDEPLSAELEDTAEDIEILPEPGERAGLDAAPAAEDSEPEEDGEPELEEDEPEEDGEPEFEEDGEPEEDGEQAATPPEDGEPATTRRRKRRRRRRRKPAERDDAEAAAPQPARQEQEAQPPAPIAAPAASPAEAPAPIQVMPVAIEPASMLPDLGARTVVYAAPERPQAVDERKIAMFCDFENIALGVRGSERKKLDFNLILERLLEKGKIIVKKAYADWERYSEYKRPFHEAAIELIDIPQKYYSGKNSADIKMVVDAMDLCYSKEHLDTFVIVSGDSDFSPLVSKLKENNKYVIGIGVKDSSSSLLIDNCDEFIYYEDVFRETKRGEGLEHLSKKDAEVFGLMRDAMQALIRESKEVLWGSMIKQTMKRKRPSFNESYYGYSTFSELLENAERKKIIGLKRDQRSGSYIVTGFTRR